jgi:hypothetical protein
MLEQPCRRIEEVAVVVDNDATRPLINCHPFSLGQQRTDRMAASRSLCRVGKDWRSWCDAGRR